MILHHKSSGEPEFALQAERHKSNSVGQWQTELVNSTAVMGYGPDGERNLKFWSNNTSFYLGGDADILVNSANPAGLLSVALHPGVKREGSMTDYLVADHLHSNRLTLRHGGGASSHAYGPYGQPLLGNGNILAGGSNASLSGGKGYLNERIDPETGLSYLHARYQDPLLGRFLTPPPFRACGG